MEQMLESCLIAFTGKGPIDGYKVNFGHSPSFYTFDYIPYAHIPEGPRRFTLPEEISGPDFARVRERATEMGLGAENVLLLKIHIPMATQRAPLEEYNLPVIVFVPGENDHSMGPKLVEYCGPHYLLKHNVVVVQITYRFGTLGLFQHTNRHVRPCENISIEDIRMAFKWIRKEIVNFGGCPTNITAYGQSFGATNLYRLMTSDRFHGCFDKVILSSCARDKFEEYFNASNILVETTLAEFFGHSNAANMTTNDCVKYLRSLRTDFIENREEDILGIYSTRMPRSDELFNTFAIKQPPTIPVMIGYNAYESMHDDDFDPYYCRYPMLERFCEKYIEDDRMKNKFLDSLAQLYRQYWIEEENEDNDRPCDPNSLSFIKLTTDLTYLIRIMAMARSLALSESRVYLYRFNFKGKFDTPGLNAKLGSYHGSELKYIFKAFGEFDFEEGSKEHSMMEEMTTRWVLFARNGDPNPPMTPFGSSKDNSMEIWKPIMTNKLSYCLEFSNSGVKFCKIHERQRIKLWEKIYDIKFFTSCEGNEENEEEDEEEEEEEEECGGENELKDFFTNTYKMSY